MKADGASGDRISNTAGEALGCWGLICGALRIRPHIDGEVQRAEGHTAESFKREGRVPWG